MMGSNHVAQQDSEFSQALSRNFSLFHGGLDVSRIILLTKTLNICGTVLFIEKSKKSIRVPTSWPVLVVTASSSVKMTCNINVLDINVRRAPPHLPSCRKFLCLRMSEQPHFHFHNNRVHICHWKDL